MFDQLLDLVKDQLGNNPEVSNNIEGQQKEEVNREVATQLEHGLKNQAESNGGPGGLLDMLAGQFQSGNPVTSAISGGLVGTLGSKFGLPPAVTGAIAAALPGLLQKFASKAKDPNDSSINLESVTKSLSGGKGLGGLF